jgi:hypothetical protein
MSQRVPASMRTRQSLSRPDRGPPVVADGRAELVKLATRLIVEETLEAENRDALGRDYYEHGAEPGSGYRNGVRTGRLRTAEGLIGILGAADRRPRRAVPLRDPRASQGPHRGARGPGGGAAGARPVGARHRGRLPRRDRAAALVAHGGLGARRAALGRLPGVRHPRPERVRHRLSLRRRHRRAHPARPAARAGDGGLGLHRDRHQGAAAPDGGLQGGRRDGERLLPGHARPRARRSAARRLRRRARRHQGDRDLLPALGPPALPRAPHAQPRRQGARGPVARGQGARPGLLPGAEPRHRPRPRRRRRRRLRKRAAERGRLLRGRLRGLHRASQDADHPPPRDQDHESPRAPVRRGAPAAEDHPQRLRREARCSSSCSAP